MLTKANIRNVKKVRDFIAALPPKRLVMNAFVAHGKGKYRLRTTIDKKHFEEVGCGTAGCLAGWGAVALGVFNKSVVRHPGCDTYSFDPTIVGGKLGIANAHSHNIFTGRWPTVIIQKHALPVAHNGSVDLLVFDGLPSRIRKAAMLDVLDYLLLTSQDVHENSQATCTLL